VIRIAVATIALLVATCAAAGTPKPNVRGVIVGEAAIACPPGEPCDPPPKPIFVAFERRDHTSVRARIRSSGSFALYLRPGRYAIRLSPPQGQSVRPSAVRVPARGIIRLRLVVG
jgi:hypothetical protein